MKNGSRLRSYAINAVLILIVFLILNYGVQAKMINRWMQAIIMSIMINIILATSLNISTGFLGEIVLGHAGFMSIGAYTAAIFTKNLGITAQTPNAWLYFIGALILAGLVAAVFGLLVGIPALRLKGDYLAIITLGFGEIIRVIIENLTISGGAQGLKGIPRLATGPLVYVITVITVIILYTFVRSRYGRVITAIREDDIATEAVGINTTYYKIVAFVTTAFFGGVAGGIYAHYIGILGARTFNFNRSIDILVIVVLGGLGSLTGSIIAAIVLTILPEVLRSFAEYRMLIYAVALICVMLFRPKGLLGNYEFSLTKFLEKIGLFKKSVKEVPHDGVE